MPRLDCDQCDAKLWIPKDFPEPYFTCPRCLRKIPATLAESVAAAPAPEVQDGLMMSRGQRRVRPADHDALGDIKGTGGGLVLLAGLSLLGLFTSFKGVIAGSGLAVQVFIVSLVVLFTTGVLLTMTQDSPRARQIGRSILGLLGSIVALILGVIALIMVLAMVCKPAF